MRLRKLSRKSKVILIFLGICITSIVLYRLFMLYIVFGMMQPTNDRDNHNPAKQKEMLKIALDVGDLAPIPKNAVIKTIETEGNAFTRRFRVIFTADPKTIDQWLRASNGIQKAKVVKKGNTSDYILNPRLGYNYADVLIDHTASIVTLYVEWS